MMSFDTGSDVAEHIKTGGGAAVFSSGADNVCVRRLPELSSFVVSKPTAGFSPEDIVAFGDVLEEALDENPKFLIFDFAHRSAEPEGQSANDGIAELVHTAANLIANSSTVAVAWARGEMVGADLEFALSCSMIAAEPCANFTLSPYGSAYAFLARKIGLARAERAMLDRERLGAHAMRDMLLARHVADSIGDGDDAIKEFLVKNLRRHNALSHMYRAQRLVMPVPYELVRSAHGG
jgi:enoyl-CoA hydratase/carnithine racemase